MPKNERNFWRRLNHKNGAICIPGHAKYPPKAKKSDPSISIDGKIAVGKRCILIEIDSGNAAKLLIGQYVLLNLFYRGGRNKTLFLVVHYYKGYNAERTRKHFEFVAREVLQRKALPFVVFGKQDFFSLWSASRTGESVWRKLVRRSM